VRSNKFSGNLLKCSVAGRVLHPATIVIKYRKMAGVPFHKIYETGETRETLFFVILLIFKQLPVCCETK
jgi:hypothetical protein